MEYNQKPLKHNLSKTERQRMQYKFWEELLDKCNKKTNLFSTIGPSRTERFISKRVKRGWYYFTIRSENRLHAGFNTLDEEFYYYLKNKKTEIENKFGGSLLWEAFSPRERRICWECKYRFDEVEKWEIIYDQLADAMARLENALKQYTHYM